MNENSALISQRCEELRELLRDETIDDAAVTQMTDELIGLVKDAYWCSRLRDDFDWPFEELIEKGHYEETIQLIKTILDKEDCSQEQGDLHLLMGICHFHLERFEDAETEFVLAIDDDEDYADEANPYRDAIREKLK